MQAVNSLIHHYQNPLHPKGKQVNWYSGLGSAGAILNRISVQAPCLECAGVLRTPASYQNLNTTSTPVLTGINPVMTGTLWVYDINSECWLYCWRLTQKAYSTQSHFYQSLLTSLIAVVLLPSLCLPLSVVWVARASGVKTTHWFLQCIVKVIPANRNADFLLQGFWLSNLCGNFFIWM